MVSALQCLLTDAIHVVSQHKFDLRAMASMHPPAFSRRLRLYHLYTRFGSGIWRAHSPISLLKQSIYYGPTDGSLGVALLVV